MDLARTQGFFQKRLRDRLEEMALLIVLCPLIPTALLYFKLGKNPSSLLLSLSLSSGAAVFFSIRQFGSWFGGADIGFGLLMMFSPIITLPLAIAGYHWGRSLKLEKAAWISLISLATWCGLALLYNTSVGLRERAFHQKSELNCQVLPYHCALREGRISDLARIRESSARLKGLEALEAQDGWGNTPLLAGIHQPEAARTLLSLGANPNAIGQDGAPPLALVLTETSTPQLDIAQLLLSRGAEVNRLYGRGKKMTLLNAAVTRKDEKVIEFLLSNGANPTIQDDYGMDACARARLYQVRSSPLLARCSQ